jgi:hypothetical protein
MVRRKHNVTEKHRKRKERKPRCSPRTKKLSYTCYSQRSLLRMKKFWNARHPDAEIHSNDPREIWRYLRERMRHSCRNERCWLKQKFIKDHLDSTLKNHTFAPDAPESWQDKPDTWLNSLDIDRVMQQYEHVYPDFEFIGPSPIDFDKKKLYGSCVWEELCKFDLSRKLKEGVTRIGIVFNTDPHYKPGEHWIALYIDARAGYILFFNSTGEKILPEISKLVKRIQGHPEPSLRPSTHHDGVRHVCSVRDRAAANREEEARVLPETQSPRQGHARSAENLLQLESLLKTQINPSMLSN